MKLTSLQHKAFRELCLSKITYRDMFKSEGSLGYTYRARRGYDITIADDIADNKAKAIILLHELAHIFFGHMDENVVQELKNIKKQIQGRGVNYTKCMLFFRGPMSFLNIAMDLQVNTKFLTKENTDYLQNFLETINPGFKLCLPETYETEEKEVFREYYDPLVDYFLKHQDEMKISVTDGLDGDLGISVDEIMQGLEDEDEIKELLEESGYKGGNDKNSENKSGTSSSESVEEAHDEIDSLSDEKSSNKEEDKEKYENKKDKKKPGKGRSTSNLEIAEGNISKDIANFLTNIVKTSLEYRQDSLKHYNKGTRRNKDNILYTSMKRKQQVSSRILSIVVDVSGSIDTSQLATAVRSVKAVFKNLHPSSKLATCDTDILDVYSITKIPSSIRNAGGTDMYKGLKYFVDKNSQDIILYSDLETEMSTINKLIDSNPQINFYTIVTGRSTDIENFSDEEYHFLSKNRKVLLLKGN